MSITREELALQVDQAQWDWLRAHNERGALILVDSMLDMVEVGECIVADDMQKVQSWLASGLIVKPRIEQIEAWNQEPQSWFSMLVVSPYVLFQDVVK